MSVAGAKVGASLHHGPPDHRYQIPGELVFVGGGMGPGAAYQKSLGIGDLRTASFVTAIKKIAISYQELGIFP